MEPICSKTKQQLDHCYNILEKRLLREKNELCRIAVLAWMDFVAKRFGGLLYKQFKELLPYALGLKKRDGTLAISCGERAVCYEPILCLKAYLLCRKRWMKKELERMEPGTPYARIARVVLGETVIPEECGGLPPECR
ncbi:MAG: hypothetical protein ACO2PM_12820 [Pyrobaculum sp.]|jgi:hypothetical protein